MSERDPRVAIERLFDAIAESIESASDEEILEDARLAGDNVEEIAARTKAGMLDALKRHRAKGAEVITRAEGAATAGMETR